MLRMLEILQTDPDLKVRALVLELKKLWAGQKTSAKGLTTYQDLTDVLYSRGRDDVARKLSSLASEEFLGRRD